MFIKVKNTLLIYIFEIVKQKNNNPKFNNLLF